MNYCNRCHVNVTGKKIKCPLCGAPLEKLGEQEEEEKFPIIHSVYYKNHFFFKLLIFISIILATVSVVLNILLPIELYWSFFVVAGIACAWISLIILISKRNNIHKTLLWQVILILILSVLWDKWTGWHGWSIDYVIPIVCTLFMLIMAVLAKVLKLQRGDYIIYLLFDCLFAVIPLVLMILNITSISIPSLICVAVSFLSLVSLILFEGKNMLEELKARLHF